MSIKIKVNFKFRLHTCQLLVCAVDEINYVNAR